MLHSLNDTGKIIEVNQYWLDSLGYKRDEVLGQDARDFLTEASLERVNVNINPKVRKLGSVKNVPLQVVNKNGDVLDVLLSSYADRSEDGRINRVFAVLVNVTEVREMKRTISISDSILNNLQSVVIVTDRDGDIVYVNPFVQELLGYASSELIGNGWWEKVNTAGLTEKSRIARQAQGVLDVEPQPYETTVNHKSGSTKCLLFKDARGPNGLLVGVAYDITERNDAREKLKLYSSRMEIMLEIEKAMLSSENQNEILSGVLKKLIHYLTYCNRISFTTFDRGSQSAQFYFADADSPNALDTGKVIPLSEFASYEHIKDGNYVVVENLNEKEQLSPSDLEVLRSGVSSYLIMPVMYSDELIGSLNLGARFTNPFIPSDIELIQDVANEIGIAIMHQRLQDELKRKNKEIESKNKDITSSIRNAQRIQDALFPIHEFNKMNQRNESFALFRPKDIVSGDFYWVAFENDCVYFAVVDCTGHGVPGAFMSIVGFNMLNKAVKEMGLVSPSDILHYLNQQHYETFNKDSTERMLQDGMDIGLCKLDVKNNCVEFAGANHSMLLLSKKRIRTYKGKRASIGGHRDLETNIFDTYKVTVEPGDLVYLSSDGYTDQFGGPEGRKFMHQQFHRILTEIAHLPMPEQRDHLESVLENWRGDLEQLDDICVIGVRV